MSYTYIELDEKPKIQEYLNKILNKNIENKGKINQSNIKEDLKLFNDRFTYYLDKLLTDYNKYLNKKNKFNEYIIYNILNYNSIINLLGKINRINIKTEITDDIEITDDYNLYVLIDEKNNITECKFNSPINPFKLNKLDDINYFKYNINLKFTIYKHNYVYNLNVIIISKNYKIISEIKTYFKARKSSYFHYITFLLLLFIYKIDKFNFIKQLYLINEDEEVKSKKEVIKSKSNKEVIKSERNEEDKMINEILEINNKNTISRNHNILNKVSLQTLKEKISQDEIRGISEISDDINNYKYCIIINNDIINIITKPIISMEQLSYLFQSYTIKKYKYKDDDDDDDEYFCVIIKNDIEYEYKYKYTDYNIKIILLSIAKNLLITIGGNKLLNKKNYKK